MEEQIKKDQSKEDPSREIPKVDPKQQQLMIAKGMGIPAEVIKFLDKIPDWKLRELYYLCAADRMPLSDMIELAKKEDTTWEKIKKKRVDYLRQVYTDLEPIGKEIVELKKEVKVVLDESQSARDLIANHIEVAIEKQAAAQEETIQAKNAQIEMLQGKIAELENATISKMENVQMKRENAAYAQTRIKDYNITQVTLPPKKSKGGFFKLFSPKDEIKKFIAKILKDEKMSDEHKNFLITCMEEGSSLKEIEAFASPDLSIEQMRRLKELNQAK
jgi:hypothetical protein